jgi:carbamoyl-phosphate synthase small subunit
MSEYGCLVLKDGSVYWGTPFGASTSTYGEVVFTTSMTGYQEMLTDPSFAGQIVIPTYPLIGNYGINLEERESKQIRVSGFVVRNWCDLPSHGLSQMNLNDYLRNEEIPGLSQVDTRAITRKLRTHGVMLGALAINIPPETALETLREQSPYESTDFVETISTKSLYKWFQRHQNSKDGPNGEHLRGRIIVTDYGVKYNILRILKRMGFEVIVVPASMSAEEILDLSPNGVVLSPGPGDPTTLGHLVPSVQRLIGKVPILGICLGHQMIAKAFGGETFKLKFGHRGVNHPVKDIQSGRVYITAQNHGYAVDPDSLPSGLVVSQRNINDGTVEGLKHTSLPILTIQYHSEAAPGPRDNEYIFSQFTEMVESAI